MRTIVELFEQDRDNIDVTFYTESPRPVRVISIPENKEMINIAHGCNQPCCLFTVNAKELLEAIEKCIYTNNI